MIFPYADHEPKLSAEKLSHLDAVAMQVETMRLKNMGVLLPPETVQDMNPSVCPHALWSRGVTKFWMANVVGSDEPDTWRVSMPG